MLLILADDTVSLQVGELQPTEVAEEDWRTVALCNHNGTQVIKRLDKTDGANDEAKVTAGYDATAGIVVIGTNGRFNVCQRQVEPHQLLGIKLKLILGGDAAEV